MVCFLSQTGDHIGTVEFGMMGNTELSRRGLPRSRILSAIVLCGVSSLEKVITIEQIKQCWLTVPFFLDQ